jgi:hypothetical protein
LKQIRFQLGQRLKIGIRRTAELTWGETDSRFSEFSKSLFNKAAVSPSRPLNRESIHCLWQWFLLGSEAKQQTD